MSDTERLEARLREFAAPSEHALDWDDVRQRAGERPATSRVARRRLAVVLAVIVMLVAAGGSVFFATRGTRPARTGRTGGAVRTLAPHDVDFSPIHTQHPVAGRMFEGLAIINRTGLLGTAYRFTSVRCDAEVGGKRLHATHFVYRKPRRGYVQVVVCGWRIPADAAGKTLRFRRDSAFGGWRGAVVVIRGSETVGGPLISWRVKSS